MTINSEPLKHPNYVRVALQSALAAGLCLGLPAGLLFWLILAGKAGQSAIVDPSITYLQDNGLLSVFLVVFGSIPWSFLLARISGYRAWWWVALASAFGILAAWFSPLANVDGILYEQYPSLPIHINYAASMAGLVGGVTLFVGLGYGLVLRSAKAALTLGLATSLISMLSMFLTIFVFDRFGIRVGATDFAMSKVTASGLMTSAIVGGTVLGVGFSWFVNDQRTRSFRNNLTIP